MVLVRLLTGLDMLLANTLICYKTEQSCSVSRMYEDNKMYMDVKLFA